VCKRLDSFSPKTRLVGRLAQPAGPTSGQFGLRLFATSSPCVVESRTLVQFGILEDINGFHPIWVSFPHTMSLQ
jgi:hypothetical protein